MSGRISPISSCDATCAAINGCAMGGVQCMDCGRYFCADDLDADGLCADCAKSRRDEEGEDEEVTDERLARCVCGGEPRVHSDAEVGKVECPKCGRTTGWMSPASEAVGYWNYMARREAAK